MKKFWISLPKLVTPPSGVPVGQVVPLEKCSTCSSVLCSCGKCHSQQCGQVCLYQTGEKEMPDFEAMSEHLREMLENRLDS